VLLAGGASRLHPILVAPAFSVCAGVTSKVFQAGAKGGTVLVPVVPALRRLRRVVGGLAVCLESPYALAESAFTIAVCVAAIALPIVRATPALVLGLVVNQGTSRLGSLVDVPIVHGRSALVGWGAVGIGLQVVVAKPVRAAPKSVSAFRVMMAMVPVTVFHCPEQLPEGIVQSLGFLRVAVLDRLVDEPDHLVDGLDQTAVHVVVAHLGVGGGCGPG